MRKKEITLRRQIMKTMIGTTILQVVIIVSVIIMSRTSTQLNANTRQSLINTVSSSGTALERQMTNWSDMDDILAHANRIAAQYEHSKREAISEMMQDDAKRKVLLQKMLPLIVRVLRSSGATGSFVILNGEEGDKQKDALYIRDIRPDFSTGDDSDILVEAGPGEIMLQNGYALDANWSVELPIGEESDFYNKPYAAAQAYKGKMEAKNMGYWSEAFRLRPNDTEIITYSLPLLDENNNVYGVIGIEVGVEYVRNLLNNCTIVADNNAGYVLSTTKNGEEYQTVLTAGSQYQTKIPSGTIVAFKERNDELFEVFFDNMTEPHTASNYQLHLYNTNTPFEKTQWMLSGIIHERVLRHSANVFMTRMSITLEISVLIGILVSVAVSIYTTKPLHILLDGIDNMTKNHMALPKTYIREYDELADEIKKRSDELLESSSKLANIIEMTDLRLGVLEYKEGDERGFCTEKVFKIFEIDMKKIGWENNYVELQEMKAYIEKVKRMLTPEPDEKEIYYFDTIANERKWVSIHRVETEEQCLYVVLDVTADMIEKKKIKHERDYDVLTNLYNRRAFSREVKKVMREHPDTTGVMSIWDLDNLKYMNDSYGHDVGDRYIILLATVFKRMNRHNTIISRLSGDEFMMFIYNENIAKIYEVLRDVHRAFCSERMILVDGTELPVSVSAGMAAYPIDGTTYSDLAQYADFAMYEVKNSEKGAIKSFNRETYVRDYILMKGVGELNRILNDQTIHYVFQPIVDVKTHKVFAYEALMRPELTLLKGPTELLRLAESQFKLGQVEAMTWLHAIKEFKEALGEQTNRFKLFINSIPNQCLKAEEFQKIADEYGSLLSEVVMEVTEIKKADLKYEKKKYELCKQYGIEVALDDYGTGFSNNDALLTGNLNFVKIDMGIVRDIHMLPARQRLVKSIIEYCHENEILVVAEGVELKEEMLEVIRLGADYVQGYYLAKPQREIIELDDILEVLF